LEADVWQLVSGLLKDPKTLRRDLDTMIEAERATMYEDPEREAKAGMDTEAGRGRPQEITLPGHGS